MTFIGAVAGVMATVSMMMQGGIDATGTAVAMPTGEVALDPLTGSYFQIFEFYGRPPHTWEHASRMVRGYIYEGREGQLATVKDLQTHYFLITQFPKMRSVSMWIGLRATCLETAEVTWIDDTPLADTTFRAWGANTAATISRTCRDRKDSGMELPIYYNPDAFGVRWLVGNAKTNIRYMLVEFPVPKEEGEDKDADQQPEGN